MPFICRGLGLSRLSSIRCGRARDQAWLRYLGFTTIWARQDQTKRKWPQMGEEEVVREGPTTKEIHVQREKAGEVILGARKDLIRCACVEHLRILFRKLSRLASRRDAWGAFLRGK